MNESLFRRVQEGLGGISRVQEGLGRFRRYQQGLGGFRRIEKSFGMKEKCVCINDNVLVVVCYNYSHYCILVHTVRNCIIFPQSLNPHPPIHQSSKLHLNLKLSLFLCHREQISVVKILEYQEKEICTYLFFLANALLLLLLFFCAVIYYL